MFFGNQKSKEMWGGGGKKEAQQLWRNNWTDKLHMCIDIRETLNYFMACHKIDELLIKICSAQLPSKQAHTHKMFPDSSPTGGLERWALAWLEAFCGGLPFVKL